jgi:hypothetical protein
MFRTWINWCLYCSHLRLEQTNTEIIIIKLPLFQSHLVIDHYISNKRHTAVKPGSHTGTNQNDKRKWQATLTSTILKRLMKSCLSWALNHYLAFRECQVKNWPKHKTSCEFIASSHKNWLNAHGRVTYCFYYKCKPTNWSCGNVFRLLNQELLHLGPILLY